MFGDLPAEVLQQIIEPHVVGDSQSLKSCSLVCWQWRYVTLPFLMFKVIVTYGRIGTPKGRKVTVQDIRDSIPFLSQYLRHLVISTSSYILRSEDAEEANDVLHALLAAIPQLTLLSKLSLTNDGLFNLLASTQGPLSNISHFTVYQPVEILPIKTIKAFTHLRVLHLVGVSFDCHGTTVGCSRDPHEAKFPVPVLEELALRLSPISFVIFVQWACRTDTLDFSQLKTLKMAMEDGQAETYCFLDELVPLVGASIQTLDLDLYNK